MSKTCTKCHILKPLSDFNYQKGSCKVCIKIKNSQRIRKPTSAEQKNEQSRIRYELKKDDEAISQTEILSLKKRLKNLPSSPVAKSNQLSNKFRADVKRTIREGKLIGTCKQYLGCSAQEVKLYIESKFTEDMTWDNWGYSGWHLDHIKPFCKFDLSKETSLKVVGHFTNLQPLWRIDHDIKTGTDRV